MIKLNTHFIIEHMNELIQLEDYIPFSIVQYDKHHEREDFLKSKQLLTTIQEMGALIRQKCEHSEDPEKAYDSILIEWLDCHPEFEGIIDYESVVDYQIMKNSDEFTGAFIDLLYDVELPSEKEEIDFSRFDYNHDKITIKDDYSIKYPKFEKKNKIFDEYGATLLACYLSYLV